jgi:hypothetical protein
MCILLNCWSILVTLKLIHPKVLTDYFIVSKNTLIRFGFSNNILSLRRFKCKLYK